MKNSSHLKALSERLEGPFFFYDIDALDLHLKAIKSLLHPDIKVWYACKANPLSAILTTLQKNGFGVDVASTGELSQAKSAGLYGNELIATGPAKSKKYLENLLDNSISTIVLESHQQLIDLNTICAERNTKQNVLLRVQLAYDTDRKSVLGGSEITAFGLGVEDWKKISLSEYANVKVLGLHCFQWGNILDLNQLSEIWEFTIGSCVSLARDMGIQMKVLDLGGGLGIDYKGDRSLPFSQVHELLMSYKVKFALREIWLELGRFSVGEFGTYATKIVDKKSVRGKDILVTDGGINHIARPALVNEAFPAVTFLASPASKTFAVHGPLCTSLDFLGDHELSSEISPGEWIFFEKCGAYGFTESMPYFLCHDLPAEVILRNGDLEVVRNIAPSSTWNS